MIRCCLLFFSLGITPLVHPMLLSLTENSAKVFSDSSSDAQALRISIALQGFRHVLLNCVNRGDYATASQILDKVLPYPGIAVRDLLWASFYTLVSKVDSSNDLCYVLYREAFQMEHHTTKSFLTRTGCLPPIVRIGITYADRKVPGTSKVVKAAMSEEDFKFQSACDRAVMLFLPSSGEVKEKRLNGLALTDDEKVHHLRYRRAYFSLLKEFAGKKVTYVTDSWVPDGAIKFLETMKL